MKDADGRPAMTANVDGHSLNHFGFRLEFLNRAAGVAPGGESAPPRWATGFSPMSCAVFAASAERIPPAQWKMNFFSP